MGSTHLEVRRSATRKRGIALALAICAVVVSITADAAQSFKAEINRDRPFETFVSVPAVHTVTATVVGENPGMYRMQCRFDSPDRTRRFANKEGNPCVVSVSNRGSNGVTLVFAVVTDSRDRRKIEGTITRRYDDDD